MDHRAGSVPGVSALIGRGGRPSWSLLLAVVLLGMNLRTVIASLPPLLPEVRRDLGLSAVLAGLLTTLPVLCFGALAFLGPWLVRRVAIEHLLIACAAATAVAAALRGIDGLLTLFAGSLLAGVAVAVAQAILPILVRTNHPNAVGPLMGAYSMALPLGATLAGGVSVPLAHVLGSSWRASLAAWSLPAVLAALTWVAVAGRSGATRLRSPSPAPLRADPLAWAVAGFFGLQSMAFYAGLTWLPAILQAHGWSPSSAGWLQALSSLVSVLPAFTVPLLAGRSAGQRPLLAAVAATAGLGVGGLLVAPGAAPAWMVLLGLGQGGSLGLGLILPVLRARRPEVVASLTAMTLSVGYVIAAIGPWVMGAAHDAAGGWTAGLLVLLGVTILQVVPGAAAARAGSVAS